MPIIPNELRRQLKEGEHLLVCKHVYEATVARELPPHTMYSKAHTFRREDGTEGTVNWIIYCQTCKLLGNDADYIEYIWKDRQLHIADFCQDVHGGKEK